jgi:ribosomal-protein-alanine acetyltransferase
MGESVDRLGSKDVEPSAGEGATRRGARSRGSFLIRDLRAGDITAVLGIQRRSFPTDPWTSETAKGRLARSAVGRHPRAARTLERLLLFGRVSEAITGIRLACLALSGRPPSMKYMVAQSGHDVVGYACLHTVDDHEATRGPRAELEMLAVEQDRRSQGIGRVLLAELITAARTAGCGELSLHVRRSNEGARRFYERIGFEEAGVISGFYQPSGTDAFVMTFDVQAGSAMANRS